MENIDKIRHSLAHILATTIQKKYSNIKLGIGPAIENGFYYDFLFSKDETINEEDLPKIEKEMKNLISQSLPFSGREVDMAEAKKTFPNQQFKHELIDELTKNDEVITIYKTGEEFTDLCRGGHIENTKEINPNTFCLTHIAGAYWRGDETREMLTRIYGLAFETKEELEKYITFQEEAKKRDHKKLGKELDLFTFSKLVGSGLPLFTPRGTIIRDELEEFIWSLRKKRGYSKVRIPHITKKDLYEKSGHWDKFGDELFHIKTREKYEFVMKPMNCPHHTQIYSSQKRSYRELPIRYTETTAVYRDEQTGELSGLSRVRAITQDDSHLFCRISQIIEEASTTWDLIDEFYKPFGMPLQIRLSRHDPKNFNAYLGTPEIWKNAEDQLRSLIKNRKVEYIDGIGEAAFYGPKIDFIAKDSIGREWQLATIQLDFNMPERFDLTYTNEDGKEERPVMIHIAVMGAVERFMSIIIEHYAGAFPLWLSPVQVAVLPISEAQSKYAKKVENTLKENNIRTEIFEAESTIGKRIREAEMQKIPYIAVVGDNEKKDESVSIRTRGEKKSSITSVKEFVSLVEKEARERK
jgi:threonyl-tRNA synthetase